MSPLKVLQANFHYATNLNICAAIRSIRPLLKSPIAQVIISFVVGYYATAKIAQVYLLYRTHVSSSQAKLDEETSQENDSQDSHEGQDSPALNGAPSPNAPNALRLTRLQLMAYDGMREGEPVYTALNGNIYDLSSSRDTFLKPGPCSLLAGNNANQVLSIACGSMGVSTADLIQRWERSLNAEFQIIGQLIDSDDDSDSDELL
ncbi:hypothetical protein AWZ03_008472 [Drosophila navojoa]|uniref:Cytochrome b5 heme-binding domain-containing protein n=1 Tax=Drosophila navojoa TaxID=7232 RepID=A0A484B907_DRONA|nr:membrane steroid-binding protein 2 [Drosophila navojoa]TDG45134.1 hypothetical protein AWZ03_008472 [Drosophila navojoa]